MINGYRKNRWGKCGRRFVYALLLFALIRIHIPYSVKAETSNDLLDNKNELVELLLDYPYLNRIFMYEYEELFFCFLENNCDIYSELLTREDGVTCLLRKYQNSNFENWVGKGCIRLRLKM